MALVKIRMLNQGPNKNHHKGDVLEVDAARAARLVAGEYAEEVKDGDAIRPNGREGLPSTVRPVGKQ